ncbi:hypothetical protein KAX22_09510 [bacterium]|nr:hypothetical protein [bacterium]
MRLSVKLFKSQKIKVLTKRQTFIFIYLRWVDLEGISCLEMILDKQLSRRGPWPLLRPQDSCAYQVQLLFRENRLAERNRGKKSYKEKNKKNKKTS